MAAENVPDLLYHTTLTVIDYHKDLTGATRSIYVLGTHSTIQAAKSFAATALQDLNYAPDDFVEYEVRSDEPWKHGDGVIVFAKAPAGQVFLVGLDTTPNTESLLEGSNGQIILPGGSSLLHYILQTTIDYNQDRTGSQQSTQIEGCFIHRADALTAARKCLSRDQFIEFDVRDSEDMLGEWPYGEHVVVHAVAETGQNCVVAVKTVPGAHKAHAKKA